MVVALMAGMPLAAQAQIVPAGGMMRYPDVSESQVCFVYANDIWVAPKEGGLASPLASPPGMETFPRFSPDGKRIAFVGNYDGGRDLYTIGVTGGTPTRVTHHPSGETLADWSSDGKSLVFLTNGLAGLARQTQLFKVGAEGGLPEKFPVPYSGFGAVSPDGTWLAYTPHSTDTRTWKRYRGGMATDIWLYNLKDNSAKKITDWEGTDTIPMWAPADPSKVYYLSDNGPEHRLNIWSYELASGKREQVTAYKDDDIKWPSMGPGKGGRGEIIFQLGSKLMLLDLPSRVEKEVKVTIPGARPKLRTKTVDAAENVADMSISPTGKRIAVEARGDLWSVPVKEGITRAFTTSDGFAERSPTWSPDGRWIAYFSDESGEYELWVRPSDAKPPEEKKEGKGGDAKKGEDKAGEEKADEASNEAKKEGEPKAAPRKLTDLGPGFRYSPNWSPDSKSIVFTDQAGRLMITDVASGKTRELDKDPWMNTPQASWSSDSKWIAYTRADEANRQSVVWVVEAATGQKHQITSPMFASASPAFDRDGDYLFCVSTRTFDSPIYSDIDLSFVYAKSDNILMIPLRKDIKSPWLAESDEEHWKKEEKKDAKPAEKKDEKKEGDAKKDAAPAADDGVSGTWQGSASGADPSGAEIPFSLILKLEGDGKISVKAVSAMGSGEGQGTYDKATGQFTVTISLGEGAATLTGTLKEGKAEGAWSAGEASGKWKATRSSAGGAGGGKADAKGDKADAKDKKEVKIDFEGIESRAMVLPIGAGNFAGLTVADGAKLLFIRGSARGEGGQPGIKIYDYKSDDKEEKLVVAGGGYDLSADGKKILVRRGAGAAIHDAAAGGGKAQNVSVSGLRKTINPRDEWKQIFTDAWRIERDFFYEPTMHGVDWKAMREHYGAMIEDASSREDLNFILAELISELNIGHAYVTAQGDVEGQPGIGVGMLGCDYALESSDKGKAYKITKIYTGGTWDSDARGPLSQPGIDVKEGEYLLAVNGVPLDTTQDPWAAFVGLAGKTVSLTINSSPAMDGKEREVIVKTLGDEGNLRYRAWIEAKRASVEQASGGDIGYIYVPNTGVDGQNDLFRQFYGQAGKKALIIDERWNGGGQIPTRFIELLNRPVTNFWARRDGKDWIWPPDSHQGPKAMLINGLAGSGGDMFPWLFKHNKIGKVFGTRTWGGLVGISGNPSLIDGGYVSVPTFGFYKTDGNWGIEGHGTDPDVEVIDDPSKMVNGGDPQLDAAIAHLKNEITTNGFNPPKRPESPTYRKGMGSREQDR